MNYKWKVLGSTGNEYHVALDDGEFRCNCIGYENHKKCYHSSYIKSCYEKKITPKETASSVNKIKIFNN